jgi:hypothetical protein
MYGVVCPGTKRCVDQGSDTTLGLVAARYANQDSFTQFILETGVPSTKRPASGSIL